jgi:hypothetical protein
MIVVHEHFEAELPESIYSAGFILDANGEVEVTVLTTLDAHESINSPATRYPGLHAPVGQPAEHAKDIMRLHTCQSTPGPGGRSPFVCGAGRYSWCLGRQGSGRGGPSRRCSLRGHT